MTDYLLGVITPFAAIAGLALVIAIAWLVAGLARKAWASVHLRLIETVEIEVRDEVYLFGEDDGTDRKLRKRIRKANAVRDALVRAPGRLLSIQALGFRVLIAREWREATRT